MEIQELFEEVLSSIEVEEEITLNPEKRYHLITGVDSGKEAWWLLEVDLIKEPLLKKVHLNQDLDLSDLGKIVKSGFGKPPENLKT